MKNNLLAYDEALQLRELGFNIWTFNLFDMGGKEYHAYEPNIQRSISQFLKRPFVAGALQWIRESNGDEFFFYVDCFYSPHNKCVVYQGKLLDSIGIIIKERTLLYPDYPSAERDLLKIVLKFIKERR